MTSFFHYSGFDCVLRTHRHLNNRLSLTLQTADSESNRRRGFIPGRVVANASIYLPVNRFFQMGDEEAALADADDRQGLLRALRHAGLVQDTGKRYYHAGAGFTVVRLVKDAPACSRPAVVKGRAVV